MTLEEHIKKIKPSVYIKVIVNGKFTLFNCLKSKMKEKEHMNYIEGFMTLPVMVTEKTFYCTYNCVKLYVISKELENRCLMLENIWYDSLNVYMKRKEVYGW